MKKTQKDSEQTLKTKPNLPGAVGRGSAEQRGRRAWGDGLRATCALNAPCLVGREGVKSGADTTPGDASGSWGSFSPSYALITHTRGPRATEEKELAQGHFKGEDKRLVC